MALQKLYKKDSDIRTASLVGLSSALEYYDFAIFGMMAKYLAEVFFSTKEVDAAVVFVYLMFSLAYFARPIGGLIFGMIGDHFGRKVSLLLITMIMAMSTLAIGFLPTGQVSGIFSGIFLALLRFLQGLSYGAELPGALVVVSECTKPAKMASRCSIVMAVTGLGTVFSSIMLYLMSNFLDYQTIIAWGWRLPFIFGGILAVINYYFRRKIMIAGSLKFTHKNVLSPLKDLVVNYSCNTVLGVLLTSFFACLLLMDIYFITYFPDNYAYQTKDMYFARFISRLLSSVSFILFGLLVDRIGSVKLILYNLCIFIISIGLYVVFDPLEQGKFSTLVICLSLYETMLVAYGAAFIPMIIKFFASNVRFTGMAVCYNFGFALVGFLPKTFTNLINDYDEPLVIFITPVCLALLILAAMTLWHKQPKIFKLKHVE